MDSPKSSTAELKCGKVSTPKHNRRLFWSEVLDDSSPKLCGVQEKQEEVGWDDSPEPIKFDPKFVTTYGRKRTDSKGSPISSHPRLKRRPPVHPLRRDSQVINDLALMDNLSKKVMSCAENKNLETTELLQDDLVESLIACTQRVEKSTVVSRIEPNSVPISEITSESTVINMPVKRCLDSNKMLSGASSNSSKASSRACLLFAPLSSSIPKHSVNNDLTKSSTTLTKTSLVHSSRSSSSEGSFSSFDGSQKISNVSDESLDVVESFRADMDDEWLSQVVLDSKKTPSKPKSTFLKSRSENHLPSPGLSPQFRRTASFNHQKLINEQQPLKKQKSFHDVERTSTQEKCTIAEIENKRLEAKFRREYHEIQRKKSEAMRRLKAKLENKTTEASSR